MDVLNMNSLIQISTLRKKDNSELAYISKNILIC